SLIFRPAEVSLMETMAEDGCVGAMHGLGTFWRKRVGGRNPSRSPARKLASTWLEKAWKAGDMDAGAELGVLRIETSRAYTTGLGPFPDRVVEQLRRLAEQDSPRGCDQYAIVTYKMTLSREDKEQCFAWMRRAAELGWCENNLDIAVRLARGFTDFHWNVSKEDGMALLRHGAACGLDEFAAEYAPFRMCGLDGEAADVPGGLAMLEKAAANGSLTAMARLADILTQGLFGIGPDMRRGLALAAKAMSGGSGRAASLLAFATLGLFGEECRALSPMPWWEARTRLTSDPERTDPLFTVFRSLWPDRAAELADSIFPIGMSSAIGAGEADDGETDDEFLKEKLNHVGYETEMLWGEALRFADMAVLQLVARAFAEMPDRVRARHLAEGFSNGLLPFGAKPLPLGEVRAVMARALAKPAAVVREYDVR
ncbi:MAG: hypothetical protein Q4F72_08435, partial [Desulfovibrionaceae bacterium]|nr:hypothetical protein [Desulfovibrionaceae bacterium]